MSSTSEELSASHVEKHGFLGDKNWASPKLVTYCAESARPGYLTCQAHEYLDTDEVLKEKIKMLVDLMRKSKSTILYTGAGISTASGIKDYATKSTSGLLANTKKVVSGFSARPTLSHRVLVALHRAGLIKGWIQQNHDGLPQKAGFPQAAMNEIHGAWYDPSNPVVKFSGNLRDDLFANLLELEQEADLCLALGTSLAGMNADRVPISTAQRAQRRNSSSLGTVIINLQQTKRDAMCTLRVFSRLDDAMAMLAAEFAVPPAAYADDNPDPSFLVPSVPPRALSQNVFIVPYDKAGRLLSPPPPPAAGMQLDLRVGARVRATAGKYAGEIGEVVGRKKEGHYEIRVPYKGPEGPGTVALTLGLWWIEAAATGAVPLLPVVNVSPTVVGGGGAAVAAGKKRAAR